MKKETTSRMNYIIELLLSKKDISIKDVSNSLKISLRQVRYDILKINENIGNAGNVPVLETDNKGSIIINDIEKLLQFNEYQKESFKFLKKQRIDLLVVIVALCIEELNLNKLSKQLKVTRVTIKNDLKEIEQKLKHFNIKLMYSNGFYLAGNDEDIFEFRLASFKILEYSLFKDNFETIEELISEYIRTKFPPIKLRDIFPIIKKFIKKNNIIMNDPELYWFASIIILMAWYIYNDILIPDKRHLNTKLQNFEYDEFFIDIEDFVHITINNQNKRQMKNAISAICYNGIIEKQCLNKKIIYYIVQLIDSMPCKYAESFKEDIDLLNGLYKHLVCCYNKDLAELEVPFFEEYNFILDEELEKHIDKFGTVNNEIINVSNKDELSLLKLHFANSIYRRSINKDKRVVLISGISKFNQMQLKDFLESSFEIEIVDIISKYDIPFFQQWEELDLILFTETIPEYFSRNKPVAKINLILDSTDFILLNNLGVVPRKKTVNLYDLYHEMDFLDYKERFKVLQLVKKSISNYVPFFNDEQYNPIEIKKVDSLEIDQEYIYVHKNIFLIYELGENNQINFSFKENKTILQVVGTNVSLLCNLLFRCKRKVKEIDFFKMSDSEIFDFLLDV